MEPVLQAAATAATLIADGENARFVAVGLGIGWQGSWNCCASIWPGPFLQLKSRHWQPGTLRSGVHNISRQFRYNEREGVKQNGKWR
jgi:hypothetical protein